MKIKLIALSIALLIVAGCRTGPAPRRGDVVVDPEGAGAATAETEQASTPTPTANRLLTGGTTILAEGQLVTANPVLPLSFRNAGRLLSIEVAVGEVVAPGDLIATLDDEELQDAVTSAEMQLAQAENSLAQAQLTLDDLLDWEVDETAVNLAEANLAAAEAAHERAQAQDAAAGNNLTSALINLRRAERGLADAQEAYETAFDPGREWELYIDDPSCLPGQGGVVPCTGVSLSIKMENEREGAERAVQGAEENLTLARASYNLAVSNLSENSALQAQAAVISAQQTLEQTRTGPKETDIAAARLRVEQSELALEQAQFSLDQAEEALENAVLISPAAGEVLTADAVPGTFIGGGMPIITLLDTKMLEFHTSNLSERDLAEVEVGQPARISLKTYPGLEIGGTVSRIVPQASGLVGDAATFTVIVALDESDLRLLAGMTGRVEIRNKPEGG